MAVCSWCVAMKELYCIYATIDMSQLQDVFQPIRRGWQSLKLSALWMFWASCLLLSEVAFLFAMESSVIRLCLRLWGRKRDVFLCGIRLILNH